MNKEIKFNAWISSIKLMLYEVTIYGYGMMGIYSDDFQDVIDKLPEHIQFLDDGVYNSDEDHFDLLLTIGQGKDWIYIEKDGFIPLQYTGLKDKNGKEIYEGDIIRCKVIDKYNNFVMEDIREIYLTNSESYKALAPYGSIPGSDIPDREVIGNIYENPELLNK